jgi:hypothetical protein
LPSAARRINHDAAEAGPCYFGRQGDALMDRIPAPPEPPAATPLDEAALDAFINSAEFDQFLLDCFAEGVREAVAEQRALGLLEAPAA